MTQDRTEVARVKMSKTGPEFSRLVWGSMRMESQFDSAKDVSAHLSWLYDQGITTLDTACVYGDPHPYTVEEILGKAINEVGRDKFEIVTKCGIQRISKHRTQNRVRHFDVSEKEILSSADRSLQKLGIDVIDVMLVHRPDYLMDPDETAGALDQLVASGKVRHIGVSNLSPSRVNLLASRLKTPVMTNQVEFSPLHLDPIADGTFDQSITSGFRPMIWSPVGGGRLLKSTDETIVALRDFLGEVALKYGLSGPAEAAMAFVSRHPAGGVPIVGSGKRQRIKDAIKAVNTDMDRQDWYEIVSKTNPSLFM